MFQRFQKNIALAYIYELTEFDGLISCDSKVILKIDPVLWTNICHDVMHLVNHGVVKMQKLEYLENRTKLFYETKNSLTCASDDTF